jgi:hypothetical protein
MPHGQPPADGSMCTVTAHPEPAAGEEKFHRGAECVGGGVGSPDRAAAAPRPDPCARRNDLTCLLYYRHSRVQHSVVWL